MNSTTQHRESKRDQIRAFFSEHMGERFPTIDMHIKFGSAFRSRTSEINNDRNCAIVIRNYTQRLPDGREISCYWAEPKFLQHSDVASSDTFPEFGDLAPESEYPG